MFHIIIITNNKNSKEGDVQHFLYRMGQKVSPICFTLMILITINIQEKSNSLT